MKSLHVLLAAAALWTVGTFAACADKGDITVDPNNEAITYMGRVVHTDSAGVLFNYPGVTATINFEGKGLAMKATPGSKYFMVEIDGGEPFKINFADSIDRIVIADSLSSGAHNARVVYAIEGHEMQPAFLGFDIIGPGAKLLPATKLPDLKIEFIGNSITCGYGTEADSAQVHFSFETENNTLAYSYLTGRELDANFNIVARSGIGMYRSYGGPREGTPGNRMPDVYDRALYYTADYDWDHSSFDPDIICINLGTNDTSMDNIDFDLFEQMYASFVDHLRDVHPNSKIVMMTGCMLNGELLEKMKLSHDRVAANREGVYRFDFTPCTGDLGYGADWHPSRGQQARMSSELVPYLRDLLKAAE